MSVLGEYFHERETRGEVLGGEAVLKEEAVLDEEVAIK